MYQSTLRPTRSVRSARGNGAGAASSYQPDKKGTPATATP